MFPFVKGSFSNQRRMHLQRGMECVRAGTPHGMSIENCCPHLSWHHL